MKGVKVVTRYRSRTSQTQSRTFNPRPIYRVEDKSMDPTEIKTPKITVKTIQWYGIPDTFDVKHKDQTYTLTRDEMLAEFKNQNPKAPKHYDLKVSRHSQAKIYMGYLNRSKLLGKWLVFMNNPKIDDKQTSLKSHRTTMFFRQVADEGWDRVHRFNVDDVDDYEVRFGADIPRSLIVKLDYEEGLKEGLSVVKYQKTLTGARKALSAKINNTQRQDYDNWPKLEGLHLVNARLKNTDLSYSRNLHTGLKRSVDRAVGGDHRDATEMVIER